jgi:competence protein ComEC
VSALPALLAGVAIGILAADQALLPNSPALAAGGAVLTLVAIAIRRPWAVAATAVLLGAALGAWRGAAAELPVGPGSLANHVATGSLTLRGTIAEEPRPRGERQQVVLDDVSVAEEEPRGGSRALDGRLLVRLPRGLAVATGDVLAFEAELEAPRDFDGFAYREYLARQGVAAIASPRRSVVAGHQLGPLQEALRGLRAALLNGLNRAVPEPEAALAAGIVLGARSGIDPAINDAFAAAGLTHVVAISGWNIAMVAALAAGMSRPLTRLPGGRAAAATAAALLVTAYVLLTGASPSVLRAALMAGGLLLARLGGSRSHAMSALMLAALVMLLAAPSVLWDVGFQLSALATAGLIWFGAPFEARLARWPALIREPVALTMAAQVTTLPVILLSFERLSLVAPLANVVVVPLVPVVMLTASLAAVAGAIPAMPLVGPFCSWSAGGAAWLYLRVMIDAGQLAAAVPMASVPLSAPPWLAAAWYPCVLVASRHLAGGSRKASKAMPEPGGFATGLLRPRMLGLGTLVVLATVTLATRPDGRLHVVALDVGQGDAILIRGPTGETALIDGGPEPDLAMRRVGEYLPFWQRRLDAVVLTHPHEDHVAGLVPALERFDVGSVLDPGRDYDNPSYRRFLELAAAGPPDSYQLARAGDEHALGPNVALTVLYPTEADAQAPLLDDDVNNGSVVLLLTAGEFSALLTGDAEAPVEELLLQRGLVPDVNVLKIGHHGSESSSTPEFLAAARPEVAMISCGVDNEYGHPHSITLEHLAADGVMVRRTDLEGSVEIVVSPRPLASAHGGSRPRPGDGAARLAGPAGRDRDPLPRRGAGGRRGRPTGERRRRAGGRAAGGGGGAAARHRQARDPRRNRRARAGRRRAADRDGLRRAGRSGGITPSDLPAG